jgi:hypothetical protein
MSTAATIQRKSNKKADADAAAAVLKYCSDYATLRGLMSTFPNVNAGWERHLEGWPVRNLDGGSVIAYFTTEHAANAAVVKARRAFPGDWFARG